MSVFEGACSDFVPHAVMISIVHAERLVVDQEQCATNFILRISLEFLVYKIFTILQKLSPKRVSSE